MATLKSLVVPAGFLLIGVSLAAAPSWLPLTQPALNFLEYAALMGGLLLAWRFHSSRTFLALAVLFVAQQILGLAGSENISAGTPGWTAIVAVSVIVPINFAFITLMRERGFTIDSTAPIGLLLFAECTAIAVLCRVAQTTPVAAHRVHRIVSTASLPGYAWVVFAIVATFLLVRFLIQRKPFDSALLCSTSAFFLWLRFIGDLRASSVYLLTAACILGASIIENSYLLAYHDELTTLPSRRAFNDAMMRLQNPFTIAAVDIDHFKRFNDTYGHDTGDQVLRLVASNLAQVTGGGQAYRCGGEEFTILFPGKTCQEVSDHLERLRKAIESSEFRLRGEDRRELPRGPDRRNDLTRKRTRKPQPIRSDDREGRSVSVTVSIGVAASNTLGADPTAVLELADKALYRAKANGRNRVEMAMTTRRRTRAKAAGIA